jgi:hypothetical protein
MRAGKLFVRRRRRRMMLLPPRQSSDDSSRASCETDADRALDRNGAITPMRRISSSAARSALVLALLAFAQAAGAALVITNVRIIDVVAGVAGEASDVAIDAGRITAIRPAGEPSAGTTERFDGSGLYLVPGYWDMHAHVNAPELAASWLLPSFLAAGVTGVRDMAGDCWNVGCEDSIAFTRGLQQRISSGELSGPRIVAISSAAVGGPRVGEPGMPVWATPANAAQARKLADEARRRGVDLIKPYDTMTRAAYFAMMKRAREIGMPVGGHVPMSVSTLEAVRAGQRSIDHAKHPAIDCSRFSRTFHDVFAAWAAGDSQRIYRSWAEPGAAADNLGGYYQPILALHDETLCTQVIAEFAASGAYYVPTLITRKFEAFADESAFLDDSRLAGVPEAVRASWSEDAGNYRRRFADAAEKRAYVDLYRLAVRLVGESHRAGVPVLIGTDSPDSYCFPGSGYHDEMRELSQAGLSNADILRSATIVAARFMKLDDRFGSVAVGKTADLVLLEANPLDDIANAARIAALVRDGKLLDRAALGVLGQRAATGQP